MRNKKIIIAGGTGFIGQAMAQYFGKDNHVVILTRQSVNAHNNNHNNRLIKASDGYNITYWRWDGKHVETHWLNDIEGCDVVINLAGKSVNCRYNERNKREVLASRVDATRGWLARPFAMLKNLRSYGSVRHRPPFTVMLWTGHRKKKNGEISDTEAG